MSIQYNAFQLLVSAGERVCVHGRNGTVKELAVLEVSGDEHFSNYPNTIREECMAIAEAEGIDDFDAYVADCFQYGLPGVKVEAAVVFDGEQAAELIGLEELHPYIR